MLEELVDWVVKRVGEAGYAGVIVMMALESSFVPFPSEVVMPPAGYHASEGTMHVGLVIACGIAGSLIGALLNYGLAVWLGRPALLRIGRWPVLRWFLSERKLVRMEAYFQKHGEVTTFVGRLIPVVRQYISFPAGLARMRLWRFTLFTAAGAGIWVTILTAIGYSLGQLRRDMGPDAFDVAVKEQAGTVLLVLAPVLVILIVAYLLWHRWFDRRLDRLVEASASAPATDTPPPPES